MFATCMDYCVASLSSRSKAIGNPEMGIMKKVTHYEYYSGSDNLTSEFPWDPGKGLRFKPPFDMTIKCLRLDGSTCSNDM